MQRPDPNDLRLQKLRQWRTAPPRDLSLGAFLKKQFKQEVERPYKQLAAIGPVWAALIPPELAAHSRLESLSRGVLRVAVDSSARLYELDTLLRNGLERQLIQAYRGPAFRRVQLRVGDPAAWAPPPRRGSPGAGADAGLPESADPAA